MAISALGAGLSGLTANQRALDVVGHNVANINTQNFQPQQASFQESVPAGGGVTLSPQGLGLAAADGSSGTEVASSVVNQMIYQAGFQLSAKVVQAADERLGTMIDMKA